MIDYSLVKKASIDDVLFISKLVSLVKKAEELEDIVLQSYGSLEEGKSITVFENDTHEREYIFKENGILYWRAFRYHFPYQMAIDKEEIFILLRSDYLIKEVYPTEKKDELYYTEEGALSLACAYFLDFVAGIK